MFENVALNSTLSNLKGSRTRFYTANGTLCLHCSHDYVTHSYGGFIAKLKTHIHNAHQLVVITTMRYALFPRTHDFRVDKAQENERTLARKSGMKTCTLMSGVGKGELSPELRFRYF